MMFSPSHRWLLLLALVISGILWLAVSSVTANAVHILAKDNFTWYKFGSASIELIVINLVWALFAGYSLSANAQLSARVQFLSLCAVTVWTGSLLSLLGVGDPWIDSVGASIVFGLLFWIIEIAGAAVLVAHFFRRSVPFVGLQNQAFLIAITLTWLIAAKTAFLCLCPGISIRL